MNLSIDLWKEADSNHKKIPDLEKKVENQRKEIAQFSDSIVQSLSVDFLLSSLNRVSSSVAYTVETTPHNLCLCTSVLSISFPIEFLPIYQLFQSFHQIVLVL